MPKIKQLPGTARGYEVRSASYEEYLEARKQQRAKQIPKGEKKQPIGVTRSDPTKYRGGGGGIKEIRDPYDPTGRGRPRTRLK